MNPEPTYPLFMFLRVTAVEIPRVGLNEHEYELCNMMKRHVEFQYMQG